MSRSLNSLPQVSLPPENLEIHWKADPKRGLEAKVEIRPHKFPCEAGREYAQFLRNPGVSKVVYPSSEDNQSQLRFKDGHLPTPVRVP